jgi:hypothetical protein
MSSIFQIAEPPSGSRNGTAWVVKTSTWKEVRPYEWPNLLDRDRQLLAQEGSKALTGLRIPTSDPLWAHFREPPPRPVHHGLPPRPAPEVVNAGNGQAPPSTSSSTAKAANGAITTKQKTAKPKAPRDVPIAAKDEGARAAREVSDAAARSRFEARLAKSESREEVKKPRASVSVEDQLTAATSSTSIKATSPLPSHSRAPSASSLSGIAAPSSSRELVKPKLSEHERDQMSSEKGKGRDRPPEARVKLEDRGRDTDIETDADERARRRAQVASRLERPPAPAVKRKSSEEGELEEDEPGEIAPPKRRRMDDYGDRERDRNRARDAPVARPTISSRQERETSVKKREPERSARENGTEGATSLNTRSPSTQPSVRRRRSPSPPPARSKATTRAPSEVSTSSKRRRAEEIYTSSEDESEPAPPRTAIKPRAPSPSRTSSSTSIPRTKVKVEGGKPSARSVGSPSGRPVVKVKQEDDVRRGSSSTIPSSTKIKREADRRPSPSVRPSVKAKKEEVRRPKLEPEDGPLPAVLKSSKTRPANGGSSPRSRREYLRARYDKIHTRYMLKHTTLKQQRQRLQALIDGSGSDSDDEVDIMDTERLSALKADLLKDEKELKKIRREFEEAED